jgi:Tol biopolymer transport system component
MTPPNPDEGMPIGRYDLWLKLLFTHEYTHILQFEQTPWIWNQINTAAGGLLLSGFPQLPIEITLNLPDLLSNPPAFVLEGHAVHTETHFSGGGREMEGDFEMERRMAVLAGREPSFDQIVGRFLLDWPVAGYEYTWGNAYINHVTKHYGEDAPIKIFKAYGSVPYRGYDDATHSVLGKGTQRVWDDMMAELREKYTKDEAAWAARIAGGKFPKPKELTTTGRYHRHPVWKPDGTLLYGEALKNKGPKLMVSKLDGKDATVVMGKSTRSAIAYDAKQDKYIYESDTSDTPKGLTSFRDLFAFDPKTKKAQRLTHGARTYAPAISPDGEKIVTTTSGGGKSGIAIFDTAGKQLQKWAFENNDYQFGNPVWSPDSKRLAIAVWHGGSRDLWLLDPATSEWRQLWADAAVDIYPQFTPDGTKLVFTSDRTGTFNLYAYDLETHALRQLTDVLGGAFDPAVSPDGKTVAFANYTGRGYDIATIPFQPDTAPVVATLDPPAKAPGAMPLPPLPEFKAFYPYNPLYTMQPSVWFPVLGEDEWGTNLSLYSFWQDVLRMHTLTLIGGYGFYSQRLNYGIRYENDTGPINWSVGVNEYPLPGRVPLNGKDSNGDQRWGDLWQWNKSASLSFEYPGLRNPMFDPPPIDGTNWTFGVQTEQYNDYALKADKDPNAAANAPPDIVGVTTHPGVPTAHDNGYAHSAFLQWQNAHQVRYPYDYGPMSGQISTLGLEAGVTVPDPASASTVAAPLNVPGLPTGTAAFTRLWADHRFYQELPWLSKHSLAVRGTAGLVYNRNGEFYYGIWRAPFGYQPLSTINRWDLTTATDYSNRSLLMRGYSFVLGNRDVTLSTEYRLPIWEVEHGHGDFPLFLNRVYGVGFVDTGYIWGLDSTAFTLPDWLGDFKAGVGAEVRAQTTMFQAVPIDIRLGVARGLTSDGVFQINWGLGTTF